jgi:hypothetical protein
MVGGIEMTKNIFTMPLAAAVFEALTEGLSKINDEYEVYGFLSDALRHCADIQLRELERQKQNLNSTGAPPTWNLEVQWSRKDQELLNAIQARGKDLSDTVVAEYWGIDGGVQTDKPRDLEALVAAKCPNCKREPEGRWGSNLRGPYFWLMCDCEPGNMSRHKLSVSAAIEDWNTFCDFWKAAPDGN